MYLKCELEGKVTRQQWLRTTREQFFHWKEASGMCLSYVVFYCQTVCIESAVQKTKKDRAHTHTRCGGEGGREGGEGRKEMERMEREI